jgi:hypothetical protein
VNVRGGGTGCFGSLWNEKSKSSVSHTITHHHLCPHCDSSLRNSVMRTTLLRHVLRRTAACSRPSPNNNDLHHAYARTVAPRSYDTSSRPHHPHRHGSHPSICRRYSTYTSPHPAKPPRSGQPLGTTHPHLVRSGDLTPGIPASEYEERRRKLMASLPEGAVVVCMGGTVRLMSQREYLHCPWASARSVTADE